MKAGSNLEKLLQAGKFVVTAELGPPKSCDRKVVENKAQILKGWVDAVNITDNQTAIVRLSSIAAGAILIELGVEPIIQMTCRDRNRIALQSDILGASALGIKNVLALTGDHQQFGNHPQAKNVFDLDSIQLISALKTLRDEKQFLSGEEIKVAPALLIGGAANPFAQLPELELIRLGKKIAAGVDFIQTQPVFDLSGFKAWMKQFRDKGYHNQAALIAGVMPIKSLNMLKYMKDNVPGVVIPDELAARMEKAADKPAEGIALCVETIRELQKIEGVKGVHIMAVEWEQKIPEIVEKAGLPSQK